MNDAAYRIETATPASSASLARLHHAALPDDFLPSLGVDFLEQVYYPRALRSPHGTTYLAVEDTRLLGFVTIAHAADRFTGDVMRPHIMTVAARILRAGLSRPRVFIHAAGLAWSLLTTPRDPVAGEIVFIAVDGEARKRGIGTALVAEALRHLACRGVSQCRTKTLAANDGVITMYGRMGWRVRDRFRLIGRDYVTLISPVLERSIQ